MGKTPKQCEGTGVDRQQDEDDFDDEEDDGGFPSMITEYAIRPVRANRRTASLSRLHTVTNAGSDIEARFRAILVVRS